MQIKTNYRILFTNKIWNRGYHYFMENRVLLIDQDEDFLEYEVEGSQPYTLRLYSDPASRVGFRFYCSCPYDGPCKHLCAALMEGIEGGFIQIGESVENSWKQILKDFEEESRDIDLDGLLPEVSTRQKPLSPKKNHQEDSRYKLFFRVIWKNRGYNYHGYVDDEGFFLSPAGEFIKKDGSPGRIKTSVSPREGLISSETEQQLREMVQEVPAEKRRLLTFLPLLMEQPDMDLRMDISSSQRPFPIKLEAIHHIKVEWTPVARERNILFQPSFRFNHSKAYRVNHLYWERDFQHILIHPEEDADGLYYLKTEYRNIAYLEELFQRDNIFGPLAVLAWMEKPRPEIVSMEKMEGNLRSRKVLPRLRFLVEPHYGELKIWINLLYGDSEISISSRDSSLLDLSKDGQEKTLYRRDHSAETALVYRALEIPGSLRAIKEPLDLPLSLEDFFARHSRTILESDGEIFLKKEKQSISTKPLDFLISSGIDWLDIQISMEGTPLSIPEEIPPSGMIPFKGGFKMLSQEEVAKLAALLARGKTLKDRIRSSNRDLSTLSLIQEDLQEEDKRGLSRWLEALEELQQGFRGITQKKPPGLKATLRPYQKKGLQWLRFLHRFRLGGILADDMGLGKTLQAIALILHIRENQNQSPFLVIAPVSTLRNWEREIHRFAPGLKAHLYQGADRIRWDHDPGMVVLTSYHTMMRDVESFHAQNWDTVFLDESQALKNQHSQSHRMVKQLNTEQFIALSGTPVENHIGELWSLMDLLNPGILGSHRAFINRYQKPLQQGDSSRMEELKSRILPFILRRTKDEVAKDLPEREEILISLPLSPQERLFYNRQKEAHIGEILKLKKQKAKMFEISTAVLQALNSLRQCAISPSLRGGPASSSKLDLAVEKIVEAREEKHKLLVFSQYTRVLELMETRLNKKKIPFCRLDGSMTGKKREQVVQSFQDDPDLGVFLISIKAGGTGINLIEADYVLILDPWWNPAVESQAIDRSHRIGQTKAVTAYKFIAEDTVEEKVLALQRQKTDLVEGLLSGVSSPLKKMDSEELMGLF